MSKIKGLLKTEDWEKAKKINSQDGQAYIDELIARFKEKEKSA